VGAEEGQQNTIQRSVPLVAEEGEQNNIKRYIPVVA